LADGDDNEHEYSDEDGDENYNTMSSSALSKGLPKFHNTTQPTAFIADRQIQHHHSNYDVPRNLSQPILEQEDDEATNNSVQNVNISKDMLENN